MVLHTCKSFAALAALAVFTAIGPVAGTAKTTPETTDTYATSGNPIRPMDNPDPGVIRENGKWYVYHTSSGGRWSKEGRYPIMVSDDLTTWTRAGYIFTPENLPVWANDSIHWWAPEVHKVQNKYIAYFTPRQNENNTFAVGAAVADSPLGPFKDIGQPLLRTPGVGVIDVSFYHDPNTARNYLIWKEDQNDFNPPRPTPLIMQELTSNGLSLVGQPRELIRNDQPWEGVLVEAPSLAFHGGWYYLFYSGNIFAIDDYSVGVARSRNIWGPYVKNPRPILTHDKDFSGPAHQYVIQDENGTWHLFYHARLKAVDSRSRFLMHDLITWKKDGWPRINQGHPGPVSPAMVQEVRRLLEKPRAKTLPAEKRRKSAGAKPQVK